MILEIFVGLNVPGTIHRVGTWKVSNDRSNYQKYWMGVRELWVERGRNGEGQNYHAKVSCDDEVGVVVGDEDVVVLVSFVGDDVEVDKQKSKDCVKKSLLLMDNEVGVLVLVCR